MIDDSGPGILTAGQIGHDAEFRLLHGLQCDGCRFEFALEL